MIRGDDEAKLELAFKILSPLRSARKQKRLDQDYSVWVGSSAVAGRESLGCSRLGQKNPIALQANIPETTSHANQASPPHREPHGN